MATFSPSLVTTQMHALNSTKPPHIQNYLAMQEIFIFRSLQRDICTWKYMKKQQPMLSVFICYVVSCIMVTQLIVSWELSQHRQKTGLWQNKPSKMVWSSADEQKISPKKQAFSTNRHASS